MPGRRWRRRLLLELVVVPPIVDVEALESPLQVLALLAVAAVVGAVEALINVDAGHQEEPEARLALGAVFLGRVTWRKTVSISKLPSHLSDVVHGPCY